MSDIPQNQWFAIQVRSRSEQLVASLLYFKGYEHFLPMYRPISLPHPRKNRDRELPLFPGYVFCRSTPLVSGLVVTTPGVIRVLGFGNKVQPVDDCQISMLKAVLRSGFPFRPWPKLEPGDRVMIINGPLRGCQGTLKNWRNEAHLIVSVEILRRSVAVEVAIDSVTPASANILTAGNLHYHLNSESLLKHTG